MSDQANQPLDPRVEDEISLKDIVDFLVESWKTILVTGIVGVIGAVGYIFVAPNQYEATAQIQGAQITLGNPAAPTNIEDPNALIARMKLPSSYDQNSIDACGFSQKKYPQESISKMIKLSVVKGTSIIELKATALSQKVAMSCVNALFEDVREYQNSIADIFISEAKKKIDTYSKRLEEAQSFIRKADKSGSSISAAYLSTRDEVKYLTDEIVRLNDLISSANTRQTKLVSPIYSPENKVSPKRAVALVVGLFAGLFSGLLLMLGRKGYRAYKLANS